MTPACDTTNTPERSPRNDRNLGSEVPLSSRWRPVCGSASGLYGPTQLTEAGVGQVAGLESDDAEDLGYASSRVSAICGPRLNETAELLPGWEARTWVVMGERH